MRTLIIALAIGALAAGAIFSLTTERAVAPEVAAGPSYVQRDRGEGGVEIEVIFVTPAYLASGGADARRYEPDTHTVFLVAMNTHTVDLAGYDMVTVSALRAGGRVHAPLRWVSTSDNSHHRSGALIFPKVAGGQDLELVIRTVAGVPERTFRWTR